MPTLLATWQTDPESSKTKPSDISTRDTRHFQWKSLCAGANEDMQADDCQKEGF